MLYVWKKRVEFTMPTLRNQGIGRGCDRETAQRSTQRKKRDSLLYKGIARPRGPGARTPRVDYCGSRIVVTSACFSLPILFAGLVGCVRTGQRVQPGLPPAHAPAIKEILADLAANDAAIASFSADGTCTVQFPELRSTERFQGRVAFRKPAQLFVKGRHRATGSVLMTMTCVGDEYLLNFPSRGECYYQFHGYPGQDAPLAVSPSAIVSEMFFGEEWAKIGAREARIVQYDAEQGRATVVIGPVRHASRRIVVQGPPWVIVENEQLDADGNQVALTTRDQYRLLDGIRFPSRVDVQFPSDNTRMTFEMRNIRLNVVLDESLFRFKWHPKDTAHVIDPERSDTCGNRR